jgi:hypothetical protein
MRWTGHVAHIKKRYAYRVLMGEPEGKISLGRPRYRWEDNIKMDLTGTEWGSIVWIYLAQDRA